MGCRKGRGRSPSHGERFLVAAGVEKIGLVGYNRENDLFIHFDEQKTMSNPILPLPKHIAIIMDGNGRWAQRRGLSRIEGHRAGADTVERVVEECVERGIKYLTLYCFSSENWKRPQSEIDALMALLRAFLVEQRSRLTEHHIRFRVIGRRAQLPADILDEIDQTAALCENNDVLTLTLAINYGSRAEIVDAVRAIVSEAAAGKEFVPEEIDEAFFARHLYTAGIPDPDLLIRTAGESRLSNYLLWQLSYAEIYITPKCWPEFDRADFDTALTEYAQRTRKFGGLADDAKEIR